MRAIVLEKPPAGVAEHRLTRRVHDVWADVAHGALPQWQMMQATDFGEDWSWCFAIDWRRSRGFPYFIHLGEQLSRYSNVFLSGALECEMTLLEKATEWMGDAARERAPAFHDEDVTL